MMRAPHVLVLALGLMSAHSLPASANECAVGSGDRVGYTLAGDANSPNVTDLGNVSCADGFEAVPAATSDTAAGVPTAACNSSLSNNFTFSGCGCPAGQYRTGESCRLCHRAGTFSLAGASECSECPSGRFDADTVPFADLASCEVAENITSSTGRQ